MKRIIGLVVMVSLMSACSTPHVEAPANNPNPVTMPDLGASTVNIPVTIDLDLVRAELLKRLPNPLSAGSITEVLKVSTQNNASPAVTPPPACNDNSLSCLAEKARYQASLVSRNLPSVNFVVPVETQISHQVILRDINMRMTGHQFNVDVTADFSIATRFNSPIAAIGLASCGINEAMPRVQFSLPGTMTFGDKGAMHVTVGQWTLHWLKPCNLTALNISAESILNLPLLRSRVESNITSILQSSLDNIGLQAMLQKAWPMINEPREIQPSLWLTLNPQQVGFADLVGQGRTVSTALYVQAKPQLVSGSKPVQPLPPVPDLKLQPMAEGFHLALRGDVSLAKANEMLNAQLANKPIDANGHTVLIDSLRFYGSGDKAVLGLTLKQPVAADVYVLARPVFDSDKNELHLEDLDYSLATNNMLVKSASWMLSGTFRNTLMDKARFQFDRDFAGQMQQLRDARFDLGQGATLHLSLSHVQPVGLWFTPDKISSIVVADGKVSADYGNVK